jgi:hypothetical protein
MVGPKIACACSQRPHLTSECTNASGDDEGLVKHRLTRVKSPFTEGILRNIVPEGWQIVSTSVRRKTAQPEDGLVDEKSTTVVPPLYTRHNLSFVHKIQLGFVGLDYRIGHSG